jgi:hypothetical protein
LCRLQSSDRVEADAHRYAAEEEHEDDRDNIHPDDAAMAEALRSPRSVSYTEGVASPDSEAYAADDGVHIRRGMPSITEESEGARARRDPSGDTTGSQHYEENRSDIAQQYTEGFVGRKSRVDLDYTQCVTLDALICIPSLAITSAPLLSQQCSHDNPLTPTILSQRQCSHDIPLTTAILSR